MLSQENRLKKEKDFQRVYKGGKINSPFFSLRYQHSKLKKIRVGVVVGRKVSAKSVERNQLKRRIRELVREILPDIKNNLDIVLTANPSSKALNFQDMRQEIANLFKRAGLTNG
ncbi:ribonuclease P protein component [bacterium CG_4_10_14_0_2_um_filter_33_32]|nr:MAG: ribonuclease P protein component [bacterium CG2_30_33_46]PIR68022.1 MAG: ribonuclease P protein component [bacterium CG10_big_fil_rev_8_21_14_0_10_33_18]PIU76287.1 MAG: ribonuclease P protein component [bacterium CG06_land_8_20_14_3_00_33_50]PIW81127.1 MAG: ribonuclease P protein component [bacterium CG_4_8_14_3_um_filter_33_28]PIY85658.1 MAG: ribonuclease P protein component [bacterium CG_4_10_14_0_8_um_filter_33_57]PIZ85223.1 MAG: ribonuclease P protein component [bacterium CG_4_10_1